MIRMRGENSMVACGSQRNFPFLFDILALNRTSSAAVPEIIKSQLRPRSYTRRTSDPKVRNLKPGFAITDLSLLDVAALRGFARRQKWTVAQARQDDGTYHFARVA